MKNYDPTKESKYIIDLDANNLHGWEMGRYHRYCEFKWVKNIDNFYVTSISKSSLYCYILEGDLEYLHNDYPLAPEKLEITYDMLSIIAKKKC